MSESDFDWQPQLMEFVRSEIFRDGVAPLRRSAEMAVYVDSEGPVTLTLEGGSPDVRLQAPDSPDLSIRLTREALKKMADGEARDLGEMGILIVKHLTHSDPSQRISFGLHIGVVSLIRKGYLGVIPLGGSKLMKELAGRGFGSLSAIRKALGRIREK